VRVWDRIERRHDRLPITRTFRFRPSSHVIDYAVHRIRALMRRILLCGPQSCRGPQFRAYDRMIHRITGGRLVSEAISLSLALKRPERSDGDVAASRASSFIDGSARV
jgi:hypothetical protein